MDTLSLLLDDISLHGAEFIEMRMGAPWQVQVNRQAQACFHILASGHGVLEMEGQTPQTLSPGDIVIIPNGMPHRVSDSEQSDPQTIDLLAQQKTHPSETLELGGSGRPSRMISGHFRFNMDMARPLIDALPPLLHLQSISNRPPAWLNIGLMFLADEQAQKRPAQQAILNRLVDILFIECLRSYVESIPEGSGNWLLALRDPALSAALSAMHSNPQNNWTVTMLANIAHMSRSGFANRFSEVLGEPPLSYLTKHRMRLASWQLCHSRQPVCRIAEQVGYTSDTAFGQAFKRHNGYSPSQYRERFLFGSS